jgi:hypothetical protein
MRWIKQNLVLAVGGLVTVLLLAYGAYYLFDNMGKNTEVEEELGKYQASLEQLYNQKPFPSPTNIAAAKKELANMRGAMGKAQQSFAPVPAENVTGLAFKTLLDTTLYELTKSAESSGVTLPDKGYAFSFSNEKIAMQFPPNSFPMLPEQLAEIKAMCEILYGAKVNKLVSIKRVKAGEISSQSGPPGTAGADYLDAKVQLDPVLGMTFFPYQLQFESFTPELGAVLEAFSKSKYGLLVKAIMVESEPPAVAANTPGQPGNPPGSPARPGTPMTRRPAPPATAAPARPPAAAAAPGAPKPGAPAVAPKDSLTPVLNEKLVKVTLLVQSARPGVPAK